jgi:hypothetical protein
MKKRDGTSSPKTATRKSSSPKTATRKSSSPKTAKRKSSSPKTATRKSSSPKTATRKSSSPKTATRKSSPKTFVKIVLKNYIENIKFYNSSMFIETLCAFKIYKLNKKRNETYDFISQLFNFDRYTYKFIYYNKNTILEYIIVCGLYTEFELLLNELNEISENKVNCDERNVILFDRKKSAHLKNINIEKNKKIDNFTDKLLLKTQEYKINVELKKIKNDLNKFLFYCVCIKQDTRQYILRHYLLSFIKSANFKNYSHIILDDLADDTEEGVEVNREQQYIDNFLVKVGNYRIIPPHDTISNKKNISSIISTCAESTILNLLNYFHIDKNNDEGKFIIKDSYSNVLRKFYKKYDTMYKQYIDTKKTMSDWVQIVNNIDGVTYGRHGDISSMPENIIMVLNKILNLNHNNITDILNDINENNHGINVVVERKDSFQAIIDNLIKITFYKSHSMFDSILFSEIGFDINFDDDDCRLLYNIITENKISDDEIDKEIISDYLETKTEITLSNNYNISLLNKMINLTNLTIEFNQPLENSLDSLINLKHLTLSKCFKQPLKNSLDNLKNLEYLTINKNYENEILCRIQEFQKLKFLYLITAYDENIITINIDEYLLGEPPEFCTVLG